MKTNKQHKAVEEEKAHSQLFKGGLISLLLPLVIIVLIVTTSALFVKKQPKTNYHPHISYDAREAIMLVAMPLLNTAMK